MVKKYRIFNGKRYKLHATVKEWDAKGWCSDLRQSGYYCRAIKGSYDHSYIYIRKKRSKRRSRRRR